MADQPYVTFPGTAGNYISTPDTNLLDADTAHLQQAIGLWVPNANAGTITQVTDLTPVFGDFHGRWSTTATGTSFIGLSTVDINALPGVEGSTEYTFVASVAGTPSNPGVATVELRLVWYNSSGTFLSNSAVTQIPVPTDWEFVALTVTSPATAAFVQTQIIGREIQAGDSMYFDAVCLREGSDAAFVPSLRIVGTLGETIDPLDMPIVFAGDGTPLTIGEGWAGDGFSYTRYDGAAGVGPIVAQFDAADVGGVL